jgi:formylglycine-generating enzyme required for sulfatase activity
MPQPFLVLCVLLACGACGGEDTPGEPGTHETPGAGEQAPSQAGMPAEGGGPAPEKTGGTADAEVAAAEERPGMVYIPAGPFFMGRDMVVRPDRPIDKSAEHPRHEVYVDAFYIDRVEVTNEAFERFYEPNRHKRSLCDTCPVTRVTWFTATDYCARQGKRLPTEAEWEKAAKGGATSDPRPLTTYAWIHDNSPEQTTHPVGQRNPNGYGLFDMLGNAREWTADWYDPGYYRRGENHNPKGPPTGNRRVERGGAFFLPARGTTTTIRYNHPPHFRLYFLGFRCVQDP